MMIKKGYGRKQQKYIFRYYPSECMEIPRKMTKNLKVFVSKFDPEFPAKQSAT
jgi:hypothetical protein